MSAHIERYSFVTRVDDPDYIYLDNPSPMMLVRTREWFESVLGVDNVASYSLGGFFGGFNNAFKFRRSVEDTFRKEILSRLVKDGEDNYYRAEAMAEANQI